MLSVPWPFSLSLIHTHTHARAHKHTPTFSLCFLFHVCCVLMGGLNSSRCFLLTANRICPRGQTATWSEVEGGFRINLQYKPSRLATCMFFDSLVVFKLEQNYSVDFLSHNTLLSHIDKCTEHKVISVYRVPQHLGLVSLRQTDCALHPSSQIDVLRKKNILSIFFYLF